MNSSWQDNQVTNFNEPNQNRIKSSTSNQSYSTLPYILSQFPTFFDSYTRKEPKGRHLKQDSIGPIKRVLWANVHVSNESYFSFAHYKNRISMCQGYCQNQLHQSVCSSWFIFSDPHLEIFLIHTELEMLLSITSSNKSPPISCHPTGKLRLWTSETNDQICISIIHQNFISTVK